MKKMLMFMSLLITLIVSGCQCTLHTHYYNDYGVCSCGADIAQELTYSNGEYNSTTYSVNQEDTYYYKFTSHGENGVDFYLESESVKFDRIEIRADGMLQTIPTRNDDTYKYYTYDRTLATEGTYYLKVTYIGEGSIKLVIKNVNSSH